MMLDQFRRSFVRLRFTVFSFQVRRSGRSPSDLRLAVKLPRYVLQQSHRVAEARGRQLRSRLLDAMRADSVSLLGSTTWKEDPVSTTATTRAIHRTEDEGCLFVPSN